MSVSVCIDGTITITIAWRSVWFFPTSNWCMLTHTQKAHQELSAMSQGAREREPALSRFLTADGQHGCVVKAVIGCDELHV